MPQNEWATKNLYLESQKENNAHWFLGLKGYFSSWAGPLGQTATESYSLGALNFLHLLPHIQAAYLGKEGSWCFLQGNVPSHLSILLYDFWPKIELHLSITPWIYLVYPRGISLLVKLHFPVNGMGFAGILGIGMACAYIVQALPTNDLRSSFKNLLSRANQCCIEMKGDYSLWDGTILMKNHLLF